MKTLVFLAIAWLQSESVVAQQFGVAELPRNQVWSCVAANQDRSKWNCKEEGSGKTLKLWCQAPAATLRTIVNKPTLAELYVACETVLPVPPQ